MAIIQQIVLSLQTQLLLTWRSRSVLLYNMCRVLTADNTFLTVYIQILWITLHYRQPEDGEHSAEICRRVYVYR